MTRVSEKSAMVAMDRALGQAKSKLENLQLKGASLKRMSRPSDDPVGNIRLLEMKSERFNIEQFKKNAMLATTMLEFTEDSIQDLTDVMVKAKDLAISQASAFSNEDLKKDVAQEVSGLYQQAISIGNRRMGGRYIFGGYKNDLSPFDEQGRYRGDQQSTYVEVMKDFFVPLNIPGEKVFFMKDTKAPPPLKVPSFETIVDFKTSPGDRENVPDGLITQLKLFYEALLTNNTPSIQNLLERLDSSINHLIMVRTQIGSHVNTIRNAETILDGQVITNAKQRSEIEDGDVAEIYSDLTRQQNVLKAVYKTSAQMLDEGLMKFIR